MQFYPTILKDTELALSKQDQNDILRESSNAWFKDPRNLSIYIGVILLWVAIMTAANVILDKLGIDNTLNTVLLWTIVYPALFIACYYIIFNVGFLPVLYQALRTKGHDICPKCGYILITLPQSETKCPECGTQRTKPDQAPIVPSA